MPARSAALRPATATTTPMRPPTTSSITTPMSSCFCQLVSSIRPPFGCEFLRRLPSPIVSDAGEWLLGCIDALLGKAGAGHPPTGSSVDVDLLGGGEPQQPVVGRVE